MERVSRGHNDDVEGNNHSPHEREREREFWIGTVYVGSIHIAVLYLGMII